MDRKTAVPTLYSTTKILNVPDIYLQDVEL